MGPWNSDGARVIPLPGVAGREPWVTKAQLARHFDVSLKTVERWAVAGMPCLSRGRTVRYQISACEAWLGEQP
jgi:phage terminase Nu1 subunit (DNA packaging protein)